MKHSLVLFIGIFIGCVLGLVIFTITPIGLRYEYMQFADSALIRYDRWNGEALILSRGVLSEK